MGHAKCALVGNAARLWSVPIDGERLSLYRGPLAAHEFCTHSHAEYTVGIVEGGHQAFDAAGRTFHARHGDVVLIGAEVSHDGRPGEAGGFSHRSFYFSPSLVRRLLDVDRDPDVETCVLTRSPLFAPLVRLHRMLELESEWRLDYVARVGALLRCIIPGGSADARWLDSAYEPGAMRVALEQLRNAGYPPPIGVLASGAGMSRRHFARRVRALTGLAPRQYSASHRVRRARSLLEQGVPPADTATRLGFADQAHLTRVFRSVYGVTPGRVRQRH